MQKGSPYGAKPKRLPRACEVRPIGSLKDRVNKWRDRRCLREYDQSPQKKDDQHNRHQPKLFALRQEDEKLLDQLAHNIVLFKSRISRRNGLGL